jgi:hypothetical protein
MDGLANPLLDVQKYLPASVDSENYGHYEDQRRSIYKRRCCTPPTFRRSAL